MDGYREPGLVSMFVHTGAALQRTTLTLGGLRILRKKRAPTANTTTAKIPNTTAWVPEVAGERSERIICNITKYISCPNKSLKIVSNIEMY